MQKLGEGDHNSTVQYTTTSIFDDSFVEAKQLLPSNLLEEKNENHKRIIIWWKQMVHVSLVAEIEFLFSVLTFAACRSSCDVRVKLIPKTVSDARSLQREQLVQLR